MALPETLEITIGAPPSMIRSALFAPLTEASPIEADVPVKLKAMPAPGQLSSLVAGLTLPMYRNVAELPVGGTAVEVGLEDCEGVVPPPGWHCEYH